MIILGLLMGKIAVKFSMIKRFEKEEKPSGNWCFFLFKELKSF